MGPTGCSELFKVDESIGADAKRVEYLVRLLTRHQEEMFRFILAIHRHEHDARDILQESSVALCHKIEEYNPSQPFLPWAFGFAYREVLKFRERIQRENRLLNQHLIRRLTYEQAEHRLLLDERIAALDECLKKLPEADQELIRRRYLGKASIEDLMEQFGESQRTVFRNLNRIRRLLLEGINHRVAGADVP